MAASLRDGYDELWLQMQTQLGWIEMDQKGDHDGACHRSHTFHDEAELMLYFADVARSRFASRSHRIGFVNNDLMFDVAVFLACDFKRRSSKISSGLG